MLVLKITMTEFGFPKRFTLWFSWYLCKIHLLYRTLSYEHFTFAKAKLLNTCWLEKNHSKIIGYLFQDGFVTLSRCLPYTEFFLLLSWHTLIMYIVKKPKQKLYIALILKALKCLIQLFCGQILFLVKSYDNSISYLNLLC